MVKPLDRSISVLHHELAVMSGYIERSIDNMDRIIKTRDRALIEQVLADDELIDQAEKRLEQLCTCTIARYKPSAQDLREITAIFKIITDLERIGDHCSDIALLIRDIGEEPYVKVLIHIPAMTTAVKGMVRDAIDCFILKDIALARNVYERDDVVDELYRVVQQELLTIMQRDGQTVHQGMLLWMTAKYLERMADHATNVCEWIMYHVTGRRSMDEAAACVALDAIEQG